MGRMSVWKNPEMDNEFKWEDLGKRSLWRPRSRQEDSIKIDLKGVGCDASKWMDLAQNLDKWRAYVRRVMIFQVP